MATGEKSQGRFTIVLIFFIIGGVLLLFKSAYLQLIDDTYSNLAKETTIERRPLYPSRGLIYDRNRDLLVFNTPIYSIDVIYENINPDMDTALFCRLLNINKETFIKKLDKDWSDVRYAQNVPFTFLKQVPPHQYSIFAENLYKFPGFIPQLRIVRGYSYDNAAHILGYISEVNEQVLRDSANIYKLGDFIGVSGLEKYYEHLLRGKKGTEYILKDKWGLKVGSFKEGLLDSSAISGDNIIISIDIDLQAYLEKLMENKKGAVVAIEPSTGEILALVSSPTYDPGILAINRNRSKAFKRLASDTMKPFYNRAISAQYPPGSTIKPVYALIGLQEKLIKPLQPVLCRGGYHYKTYFWGCHCSGGYHNVMTAIQHSCNTYFFKLYREIIDEYGFNNPEKGIEKLKDYMTRMGLGEKLGVDLPNESPGLIPDAEYYNEMYDFQVAEWRSTYIISNGIGQGETQFTTLQLANAGAMIANRGWYITPHFLKGFKNSSKKIPEKYRIKNHVGIDKKYYDFVVKGMIKAVENGTGGLARIPGIIVAGKTGTSENPHGEDHSVFYAFAPAENPQIAIAVYVENAGYGSQYAAPIAGLGIEKYLNGEISPSKEWIERRMLEADLVHPQLASVQ